MRLLPQFMIKTAQGASGGLPQRGAARHTSNYFLQQWPSQSGGCDIRYCCHDPIFLKNRAVVESGGVPIRGAARLTSIYFFQQCHSLSGDSFT